MNKTFMVIVIAVGLLALPSIPLSAQDSTKATPTSNPYTDPQGFEASRNRLADVLFPNSASWTPYADLERVSVPDGDLPHLHDLLAQRARLNHNTPDDTESFLKSIALVGFRVLPTPDRKVRIIDAGTDVVGWPQIIVWPDYPNGLPKFASIRGRLVRVSRDARTRVVGVDGQGISGDQHEAFFRSDLWDTDNVEEIASSISLEIPRDAVSARYELQSGGQIAVRYNPRVDDTPSPNLDAPIPPIGNVVRHLKYSNFLRSYLYYRAADGSEWFLVRVGRDDERNSSDIDYEASSELGWIAMPATGPTSALEWVKTNSWQW